MNTRDKLRQLAPEDQSLRWTMRVIGILLTAASLLFLQQDIFQNSGAVWFFGFCAGLGLITLVTSWLPGPAKVRMQESPVARPVQQNNDLFPRKIAQR